MELGHQAFMIEDEFGFISGFHKERQIGQKGKFTWEDADCFTT